MPSLPFLKRYSRYAFLLLTLVIGIFLTITLVHITQLKSQTQTLMNDAKRYQVQFEQAKKELEELKSQDQVKRNDALQKEIKAIERTYNDASTVYETIQDLKAQRIKTDAFEKDLVLTLSYLSQRNLASASAVLSTLKKNIATVNQQTQVAAIPSVTTKTADAPTSNTPPSSGYAVQKVASDIGEFTVGLVAADLNSTKVIIDTASESDCRDNCPVMSLSSYAARNGAFAGINGSYFCPASYPQCAGKTNSFDTLLMNKNKVYFNSENNIYSTVPVAVFGSGFARFIRQSSGWGRDTSVDGVIANQPLLLSGGTIVFGGDGDPKKGSKGIRSFVGNKGTTVYIGVVYNATVAEAAHALKALGLENALNLDSGGSTALWAGGYKAGPGRDIPNAILFVHR